MDVPVVDEWAMLVRRDLHKAYLPQELGQHQPALTSPIGNSVHRNLPSVL